MSDYSCYVFFFRIESKKQNGHKRSSWNNITMYSLLVFYSQIHCQIVSSLVLSIFLLHLCRMVMTSVFSVPAWFCRKHIRFQSSTKPSGFIIAVFQRKSFASYMTIQAIEVIFVPKWQKIWCCVVCLNSNVLSGGGE